MSLKILVNSNALDQYIELMGEEGKEFVIEIIDIFLDDAPNQFEQLDKSLVENDSVTFRRAAHTLKTGCATVGADNLSRKVLDLESSGEKGNLTSIENDLEYCKNNFKILKEELFQKKAALQ